MMINVQSIEELGIIFGWLREKLSDWRPVWQRLEADLPEIQEAYFDARFYRGVTLARSTIEERAQALGSPVREARRRRQVNRLKGYYFENRPTGGVSADHPFVWTGSLRRATSRMTLRQATQAAIDTERSYRGPLQRMRDPVGSIMGKKRVEPFDTGAIDRALEPAIEDWLESVVLRQGVI